MAAATSVPALASGQFWPSPARGMCTSGAAPGRGKRVGMVDFGAISSASSLSCERDLESERRVLLWSLHKFWYEYV